MLSRNAKILIGIIGLLVLVIAFMMYKKKEHFEIVGEKIVLYHSPHCGHCKAMMKEWNIFASNNPMAKKINCLEEKCPDIDGFPTIKFHKKDGSFVIFNGRERTVVEFKKFVDANKSS